MHHENLLRQFLIDNCSYFLLLIANNIKTKQKIEIKINKCEFGNDVSLKNFK